MKKRAKAIHAKIRNCRKDAIHKYSTGIVKHYGAVFVGNISAAGMAESPFAKSSLDAGSVQLKDQLRYKCDHAGAVFEVVNKALSTQTCSSCGSVGGPKGLTGLNERNWLCIHCDTRHDRGVNSAINRRAAGIGRLAGGTYE
ncbi:MAG: putative transposase [Granulosicoccus sp.]|jgi:putative transposase